MPGARDVRRKPRDDAGSGLRRPPTGAGTWRARVGSVSWAGVRARILDREVIAYAGIFAAALALRLIGLGDKPFHHDESLHAWFSWRLFSGEGYHYDPVYHGPVQYYLTGLMYSLFGVGDVSARLAPALLGSAIACSPPSCAGSWDTRPR